MKLVAQNRKAYHDYHIEETVEAGVALTGTEVKSLREGRANLRDSHVIIKEGEAFLVNCHISPYSHGNISNHDPLRTRKLLMKEREISKLAGRVAQKGYSIVPLKIYFKGPWAKVEVGLARGKRLFEKRQVIREKEARREVERALKDKK
ncbi:MAG: SsrA-binding protein SmpB [Thermodesulfovibrionales bacterium]